MRKKLIFWGVVVGVVLSLCPVTLNAAQISLTSSGSLNNEGDILLVTLRASGLTSASGDSIGAFDVNFLYDPAVLALVGFTFVDATSNLNQLDFPELGAFPFLGDVQDLGSGVVDAFGVSGNTPATLDINQLGTFDLVTLRFQVLRVTPTAVSLDLMDPNLLFADSGLSALAVTYGRTTASFETQAVPEPATGGMVLLAVAIVFGRLLCSSRSSVR